MQRLERGVRETDQRGLSGESRGQMAETIEQRARGHEKKCSEPMTRGRGSV